jgi:uncharacterized protein
VEDTQGNMRKLREAYRRWHETRGGSADQFLELLADDVVLRSLAGGAPGLEWTCDRGGKADAAAYFAGLIAEWEMVHFTPEDFIADGDRVVMVGRRAFRHRRTGKVVESPKADVMRFRGGRIVECMEFYDTARAIAATQPD